MTAEEAKFSEAIISRVDCWRRSSPVHGFRHFDVHF